MDIKCGGSPCPQQGQLQRRCPWSPTRPARPLSSPAPPRLLIFGGVLGQVLFPLDFYQLVQLHGGLGILHRRVPTSPSLHEEETSVSDRAPLATLAAVRAPRRNWQVGSRSPDLSASVPPVGTCAPHVLWR